jgi:hypothetical protein
MKNQQLKENLQIEIMCHNKHEVEFTNGREALETSYDFKIKNQDINKCKFITTINIQTEKQITTDEFGEILIQLKKLNTRHKNFFKCSGMSGDRVF